MGAFLQKGDILVSDEAWPLLQRAGLDSLEAFMQFPGGTRVVHKRGRTVFRFEAEGRAFYLKRNRLNSVEFWKSFQRLKWPSLGAKREWDNILAVTDLGINTVTPVAYGERKIFGVEVASFTLTEEIYDAEPLDKIVLRDYKGDRSSQKYLEKRELITKMALLSQRLHQNGLNHQDYYLNHFFRDSSGDLYLLDLQRLQQRLRIPLRYLIKDLAQLNYSAQYYGGFTRTDRLRFLLAYRNESVLSEASRKLLEKIRRKSSRIARHDKKLYQRRLRRGELPPVGRD